MKKKFTLVLFTLVSLVMLSACGAKKLSGEYTTTINLIFEETTNTLTFDGDKVTEKQDGEPTNEGTYSISDNQLEIELGDYHMTAKLSEDKKSFTIESSDVLGGIGKGLKYTKEDN
ncbi:hypothetical protein [Enterococcus sp. DIV0187]|uniref:hypothetical protein n=1 Tax=Enterococcus sp. DIV0187 TaxID=2774644 RepID=UPI003F28618A